MTYKSVCCAVACWLVGGACAGPRPAADESERRGDYADLFVPPGTEQLCVTFEADTLPAWRVQDSRGNSEITSRIRATEGRPVQLILRTDRACTLQIPAMRIDAVAMPGRVESVWFLPVRSGEYDILVRTETEQYDGKVIVAGEKTP